MSFFAKGDKRKKRKIADKEKAEDARWEKIYKEKFEDPDYYGLKPTFRTSANLLGENFETSKAILYQEHVGYSNHHSNKRVTSSNNRKILNIRHAT